MKSRGSDFKLNKVLVQHFDLPLKIMIIVYTKEHNIEGPSRDTDLTSISGVQSLIQMVPKCVNSKGMRSEN